MILGINGYFFLAFGIGAAVGLSELLSRYSWSVRTILSAWTGLGYLALNGLAAVLAYKAAIDWGFDAALSGKPEGWRVLVVSVLAMAILRSAFVTVRAGDRDVGVGLVSFIEVFLRRTERVLDQAITERRLKRIGSIVSGLTYNATRDYFVTITESVLLSLTDNERGQLQREVLKIDELDIDNDVKMLLLAVCLANRIGEKLLTSLAAVAKAKFAEEIRQERRYKDEKLRRLTELKAGI